MSIGFLQRTLLLSIVLTVAALAGEPAPAGYAILVAAPGPDALADDVLQKAIDTVAVRGGGVVELGPGDFKLSRHGGDETIVVKSGITLRGQGYATHVYLDPATPPNPLRYYPVRIGSELVPASNVVIENMRYTGNNAKIGGGSIMGFNARLGDPASFSLSCDNITIRHCWIYGAQQAAGCTKPGGPIYTAPARLASQFKNWSVCGNTIDTCGNKAIEFSECNGGLIADNYIDNTRDGPQVIAGSCNVQIRDNHVLFTDTGINVTEGSNHIRVSGNDVEPVASINKSTANACLLFRTEPQAHVSEIFDVVVTGNIFRDQTTAQKGTLKFNTRKESLGCVFHGITIAGNVFDGDVLFFDKLSPAKTTIKDVIFTDNVCEGDLVSLPGKTMASSNVLVRGCMLRKAGAYVLHADRWIWSNNVLPSGTLTIAEGADSNVVHDNVTTGPIHDLGTATDLAGNVVRAPYSPPHEH
ncbi:MAG: right-handed parallel beta-helix repeat-containing protein [Chthoniobacter sp.]|uniref:right-handed parallel beta-helix repeat-containing protein n=1 Tax=Chthoniobacter sp. TaxID=2510640 RepID=UPI0032A701F9